MSVTIKKINLALKEAKEFIKRAEKAKEKINEYELYVFGCKETGSLKRQSMELTNVLVYLRSSKD